MSTNTLTREQKCEAIIRRMVEMANESRPVTIEHDWDGWSATIHVRGQGHTHIGSMDPPTEETWGQLVDDLYNVLHCGPGLSFV